MFDQMTTLVGSCRTSRVKSIHEMRVAVRSPTTFKVNALSSGAPVATPFDVTVMSGRRQVLVIPPRGGGGPVRSRNVPGMGGLCGERFPPQAPASSARIVYQYVRS